MKRLLSYMMLLCVVVGCTTDVRHVEMRAGLDSINMVNRSGKPFSVSDVEPYVQFFDKHGTANDRLLAHYLLGRAYYEQGEAPMALRCYYDAISKADTTDKNCDYAQLSRVYGQVAEIFYDHFMPKDQVKQIDEAVKCALYAHDTLTAIVYEEHKSGAYECMGQSDSIVAVCERVAASYRKIGYNDYAAAAMAISIRHLLKNQDTAKVRKIISSYETETSFFDKDGNIENGREIFYNLKGYYLLSQQQLDSAEFFFRKELHDGKDFNNQNAGAKGMGDMFVLKSQTDSAVKYYQYSYAMNDSMHAEIRTENLERIHSMFNYTRHQEEARTQTERATHERTTKLFSIMILVIVCILSCLIILNLKKKRKEENIKYKKSVAITARLQSEVILLQQHAQDYEMLISDKEQQINRQKQELSKFRKTRKVIDAEKRLQESESYQYLTKLAIRGQVPTDEEWNHIYMLIVEFFPEFNDFIIATKHQLNIKEYNTCILLRLHLKSQDISHMLEVSPAYISKICSEMTQKLFHEKGSVKQLAERLNTLF